MVDIPIRTAQISELSRLALKFDNLTVSTAVRAYYDNPELSYTDWQHELIVALMYAAANGG
jgi:hypothetical protein